MAVSVSTNPVVSSKTSGTTLAQTISVTAGDRVVVLLAWDPSGASVPTVSLSDGTNTYTALSTLYPAPATTSAGNGVITQAFAAPIASTNASLVITATFSVAITAKAMSVLELTNWDGTERNADLQTRGTNTGLSAFTTPSGNTGDLILSFAGWEQAAGTVTGATGTTGGTWSTVTSGGTTGNPTGSNITLAYQYKILTATGTQSATLTSAASSNWGAATFALTGISGVTALVTSAFTSSRTAIASLTQSVASSTSVTAGLTATASITKYLDASTSVTAGLTANSATPIFATASTPITAGLTSASTLTQIVSSSTSVTANLTASASLTMGIASQLSITSTLSATGPKLFTADSSLSITGSLTSSATRIANVDSSLAITASETADVQLTTNASASLSITANLSETSFVTRYANVVSSFIAFLQAKGKRSNPATDHDTVFYGQIMPRPWAGELLQRKWVAELQTERDESAELGSMVADGILMERNKFATLAQRRWEGMLL